MTQDNSPLADMAGKMSKQNDGGPAFPIPNASDMDGYVYAPQSEGMSLRDWFAGMALQGFLSYSDHYCAGSTDAGDMIKGFVLETAQDA